MGTISLESDWFYSKKKGKNEEERWRCQNSENDSKENR